MKHILIISALVMAFAACAQKAEKADTNTTTVTTGTTVASSSANSMSSPLQACNQLVDAAKNKDYERASQLMLTPKHKMGMMGKKSSKKKFNKMHENYLSEVQDISCSEEQVAGDRAFVTATTKNQERLIPFVQAEGGWKFDMKTYRSFYSDERHGKQSHSM